MQNDRRYRKRGRRRLWIAGVALTALVALMVIWWKAVSQVPDIAVPMPKLPSPNAHDDFIAASNAIIDGNKIDYAITTRHTNQTPDDHPYTLSQQAALVAENGSAFKRLQRGLHETYWAPPIRSFYTLFPYYANFRRMARLLMLKQHVETARGDWNAAINTGLDTMQMGEQIPHGATLIGNLVGIACEAIGRRDMWNEVDHLNAIQARAAARRLESILSNHFAFADTLQEEKWAGQAGLQEMFRKSNWQKEFNNLMGLQGQGGSSNSVDANPFQVIVAKFQMSLYGGPRRVLYNYTRYMDALRARARLRYGTHPPLPPIPNDPVNQVLAPVFSQADFRDVLNQAEDDLLLVTLALRAYYVEHGSYPQTLAELAPTYLSAVPQDLFAPSGTLQYRRVGAKYLLYSVGPDGKDDSGKAIDDPSRISAASPNARYQVQNNSKGDIVAGINR